MSDFTFCSTKRALNQVPFLSKKHGWLLAAGFQDNFQFPTRRSTRCGILHSASCFRPLLMAAPVVGTRVKGGNERKGPKKEKKAGWPQISTKPDLQVISLKSNLLFTVPNFFTSSESKAFIEGAKSLGFTHQGSLGPAKGEAFRDNDRISVNDPGLAESIWESGLKRLFSDIKVQGRIAVGLNPNIRFYRYKVGQRFGRHIDESVDLGEGFITLYTLLIYLTGQSDSKGKSSSSGNSDTGLLSGGETVFYDNRRGIVAEVAPVEGMALLHLHGPRCMLHEARVVTKNVKYVLRSDVVFAL